MSRKHNEIRRTLKRIQIHPLAVRAALNGFSEIHFCLRHGVVGFRRPYPHRQKTRYSKWSYTVWLWQFAAPGLAPQSYSKRCRLAHCSHMRYVKPRWSLKRLQRSLRILHRAEDRDLVTVYQEPHWYGGTWRLDGQALRADDVWAGPKNGRKIYC